MTQFGETWWLKCQSYFQWFQVVVTEKFNSIELRRLKTYCFRFVSLIAIQSLFIIIMSPYHSDHLQCIDCTVDRAGVTRCIITRLIRVPCTNNLKKIKILHHVSCQLFDFFPIHYIYVTDQRKHTFLYRHIMVLSSFFLKRQIRTKIMQKPKLYFGFLICP